LKSTSKLNTGTLLMIPEADTEQSSDDAEEVDEVDAAAGDDVSPPTRPAAKARITIWNKTQRRKMTGNAAPLETKIREYLRKHSDCEVYDGQDKTDKSPMSPSLSFGEGAAEAEAQDEAEDEVTAVVEAKTAGEVKATAKADVDAATKVKATAKAEAGPSNIDMERFRSNNAVGWRGVSTSGNKFQVNMKGKYLGTFDTAETAAHYFAEKYVAMHGTPAAADTEATPPSEEATTPSEVNKPGTVPCPKCQKQFKSHAAMSGHRRYCDPKTMRHCQKATIQVKPPDVSLPPKPAAKARITKKATHTRASDETPETVVKQAVSPLVKASRRAARGSAELWSL